MPYRRPHTATIASAAPLAPEDKAVSGGKALPYSPLTLPVSVPTFAPAAHIPASSRIIPSSTTLSPATSTTYTPPSALSSIPRPSMPVWDAESPSEPLCELFATTEQQTREERRTRREDATYEAAKIAKKIVDEGYHREHPRHEGRAPDGLCHCGEPLYMGTNAIYKNERGEFYFDHMSCRSWACPTCAPKRDYLRQKEIEQALLAAHDAGHKMVFLTFTMPHWSRDTCIKTRRAIQDAYNKMSRRSRLRRVLGELGYAHQVKCWDFTYGDNGWHPHIHAIWFFDTDADVFDLSVAVQEIVMEQWAAQVLTTCGRKVSRRHGFLCEPVYMDDGESTASTLAAYTAKRISAYSTDPDKSGSESKTPFDFLVPETHPLYAKYSRIYYDYYKGQKGIRRIRMSPNFREDYGIEGAAYTPPVQNKIAEAQRHHILFLSDIHNFRRFSELARSVGDNIALDWLDEKASEMLREELSRATDAAARFNLSDLQEHPERWAMLRREYVLDFLAGEDDEARGMTPAERARRLAIDEYNRIETMYRELERRRALDAEVSARRPAYLARVDALEVYNLMLPDDAPPMSGVGLALMSADRGRGGMLAPRRDIAGLLDEPDDFWF